ncbi:MAG: Zn-ribbon OB-fold protein [Caulobacteraceae bacterium]|nr:Zn-ribbon OB-fold protein [Caulobacteraceae bacterium]
MGESAPRLLPALTAENTDYWTGGRNGSLMIARCADCRLWIHPYSPICRRCLSQNIASEAVSGEATVASYTINHQAWTPGAEVPYVVAIVELPEQAALRIMTNIVNCPVDDVRIGDPVKVIFQHQEDVWIPLFELKTPKTGAAA